MSNNQITHKLGSFCQLKYGRNLPKSRRRGGSVPVYGSNGIVGWHDEALTTGPAIIIGRKGSVGALQYSESACHPIDTTYYVDRSCTDVSLRWLFFMLQCLDLQDLNKHVAVPGLGRDDVYEKELFVPSKEDQRRIAAMLDKANNLRLNGEASLELIKRLSRSVFIDLFGDPISNPKNWPIVPLSELASKFSDGPFGSNLKTEHYTKTGVRVWRLQDVGVGLLTDFGATYISRAHYESLPRHHCSPGDVIVGTLGEPNLRAGIILDSIPESLNKADCVQIRANVQIARGEYICALLNLPETLALAHELVQGETRSRISMGRLKTLNVALPPLKLQEAFSARLSRIVALMDLLTRRSPDLRDFSYSVQRRAFRNELDVGRLKLKEEQEEQPQTPVPLAPRVSASRPGLFAAPPEVEARVQALADRLATGVDTSIPWSEEFLKYRILGQTLQAPFNFREIWEAVSEDMEDVGYETVETAIFGYIEEGLLEQKFDESRKEILLIPRP